MLQIISGFKVSGVRISTQRRDERRWNAQQLGPLPAADEQFGEERMRLEAVGARSGGRIHGEEAFHAVDGRLRECFFVLRPIHVFRENVLEHQLWSLVVERGDA